MVQLSQTETCQNLRAYFAEQLPGWTDQASDDDLLEAFGLDSTGIALLLLYLEETFDIQILDQDLTAKNLGSIQRILAFLERKMADSE